MKYLIIATCCLVKYYSRKYILKPKKIYTLDNILDLMGIDLWYLSNTLCMKVHIAAIGEKGITLSGRWYDNYLEKYEDENSVIYCINRELNNVSLQEFLNKINEAIHTGVWYNKSNTKSYFGGRIDHLCAFR